MSTTACEALAVGSHLIPRGAAPGSGTRGRWLLSETANPSPRPPGRGTPAAPPASPTLVAIAEPDPLARFSLIRALTGHAATRVVDASVDVQGALDAVGRFRPDVFVVASRLGATSGVQVAREALARHPRLRVILLTEKPISADARRRLVDVGIHDVIERDRALDELVGIVTKDAGRASRWADLTARERSVAELLVLGLSNREIGDRLRVSYNSVKTFAQRVYAKTGTSGRMALTRLWLSRAGDGDDSGSE